MPWAVMVLDCHGDRPIPTEFQFLKRPKNMSQDLGIPLTFPLIVHQRNHRDIRQLFATI